MQIEETRQTQVKKKLRVFVKLLGFSQNLRPAFNFSRNWYQDQGSAQSALTAHQATGQDEPVLPWSTPRPCFGTCPSLRLARPFMLLQVGVPIPFPRIAWFSSQLLCPLATPLETILFITLNLNKSFMRSLLTSVVTSSRHCLHTVGTQ